MQYGPKGSLKPLILLNDKTFSTFLHTFSTYSNTSKLAIFGASKITRIANLGASKRYREFGGKEQRAEPRVREFREFGTESLQVITVYLKSC